MLEYTYTLSSNTVGLSDIHSPPILWAYKTCIPTLSSNMETTCIHSYTRKPMRHSILQSHTLIWWTIWDIPSYTLLHSYGGPYETYLLILSYTHMVDHMRHTSVYSPTLIWWTIWDIPPYALLLIWWTIWDIPPYTLLLIWWTILDIPSYTLHALIWWTIRDIPPYTLHALIWWTIRDIPPYTLLHSYGGPYETYLRILSYTRMVDHTRHTSVYSPPCDVTGWSTSDRRVAVCRRSPIPCRHTSV